MELEYFQWRFGLLQILMLNYNENDKLRHQFLFGSQFFSYNTQNVILLMPMRPDDRKREIWNIFESAKYLIAYVNVKRKRQ